MDDKTDQPLDQPPPPQQRKKKKKKKKKPKPKPDVQEDLEAANGMLTQMEQDAVAKASKRRTGKPSSTPGVVAEGGDMDANAAVQNIEEDLMAKSRNRGSGPAAAPGAVASGTTDSSILHHVEEEMMEKKRESRSSAFATTVDPAARKSAAGAGANGAGAPAVSQVRDMDSEDFKVTPQATKDDTADALFEASVAAAAAGAATEPGVGDPVAVGATTDTENYPGVYDGDAEGEALQAFVAQEEVVEATGVAVLMSEEEEEKLERQRYKRYLIFGCIAFVLIAVAVIVPLVIVVGGNDSETITNAPSPAPSAAPSASPSLAPTSFLFGATLNYLIENGVSDEEALTDVDSPQYLAADWIANDDPLSLDFTNAAEEARWLQRYRLATFYFSTNGDDWRECGRNSEGCSGTNTEWLVAEDECQWLALRCQGATPGAVNVINFNNANGNFLVGTLPEEMFDLTDLAFFLVQQNELYGTMSESWGQLTNLQDVFLRRNNFTGTVPEAFWQIRTLNRVLLDGNFFEGQISPLVSGLPLVTLRLEENLMDGPIPDEVFDLTSLVDFRLNGNAFTGPLSEQFSALSALELLHLNDNMFSGPVPAAFNTLSELRQLRLENNNLTGSLSDFCFLSAVTPSVDCEEVECPDDCCECF